MFFIEKSLTYSRIMQQKEEKKVERFYQITDKTGSRNQTSASGRPRFLRTYENTKVVFFRLTRWSTSA